MEVPEKPAVQDKCIILPFQPMSGQLLDGVGLALHFLLGNVVVLHSGLNELWFGWRIKKLFLNPVELSAYCKGASLKTSVQDLSKQQKVRFWVHGRYDHNKVSLVFYDAHRPERELSTVLPFSPADHLVEFRRAFMELFDQARLKFPEAQGRTALWEERISLHGLDAVGHALEAFYDYSAFPQQNLLELKPFEQSVAHAPNSFMAHDLMGWSYYRQQNYSKAVTAFRQALTINPYGAGAMAGLMWCGVHTRNWEETHYWAARKADICTKDIAQAKDKARKRFEKYGNERK